MNDKRRTRLSKFLSKHFRHDPAGIGLAFEFGGRVAVDALLDGCSKAGLPLSRDELREIVASSDKKRFAFDEAGTRIRANQGHSVGVDLQLDSVEPPTVRIHGTQESTLTVILRDGLRKLRRHHVHLSADVETATRVRARHGRPRILAVDAAAMSRAGHVFHVSANGVWLADEVPPEFLHLAEGPTE